MSYHPLFRCACVRVCVCGGVCACACARACGCGWVGGWVGGWKKRKWRVKSAGFAEEKPRVKGAHAPLLPQSLAKSAVAAFTCVKVCASVSTRVCVCWGTF